MAFSYKEKNTNEISRRLKQCSFLLNPIEAVFSFFHFLTPSSSPDGITWRTATSRTALFIEWANFSDFLASPINMREKLPKNFVGVSSSFHERKLRDICLVFVSLSILRCIDRIFILTSLSFSIFPVFRGASSFE